MNATPHSPKALSPQPQAAAPLPSIPSPTTPTRLSSTKFKMTGATRKWYSEPSHGLTWTTSPPLPPFDIDKRKPICQTASPLLCLPAKLRNKIYGFLEECQTILIHFGCLDDLVVWYPRWKRPARFFASTPVTVCHYSFYPRAARSATRRCPYSTQTMSSSSRRRRSFMTIMSSSNGQLDSLNSWTHGQP